MFEELAQRIETRIPQVIHSPISESHAAHYWSRRMEGVTDFPDFKQVRSEYESSSVSFSYQELCRLSNKEFFQLQLRLQTAITLFYEKNGRHVPDTIAHYVIPGDKRNVFIHEKEHLDELPERIKKEASIDIVIQSDLGGEITIDGISIYDMNATTYAENALSFSAPQSLNETDIEMAKIYAQRTGDNAFIKTISQRIQKRDVH